MNKIIQPIDTAQQLEVIERTHQFIRLAKKFYGQEFNLIPVRFNLTGATAGMYRVRNHQPELRYNPYLFAKYFAQNLSETIPHEVAHYIIHKMYDRTVRPHGPEWQQVMWDFGVEPVRTCDFDMSGIPVRRHRRFEYQCGCGIPHSMTARVHNKIVTGSRQYFCKYCGQELVIAPSA